MRGKARARIVLFATRRTTPRRAAAATLLVWAICAGLIACATAGNPDDVSFGNVADAAADARSTAISTTAREGGAQTASGDDAMPAQESTDASTETYAATGDALATGSDDASEIESDDASSVSEASTGVDASQDATLAENGDATTADATAVDAVTQEQGDDGASDAGTVGGGDASLEAGSAMDATATVDAVAVVDAATDAASPPPSGDGASDAAACGGCGAGFTCGSGGYCISSTGVPAFGHVYVIVMEEQSLSAIQGSSSAPYINTLIDSYALATNYTTPYHPSLPNYLELTSGGTQGVECDCAPGGTPTCTLSSSVCNLLASNCNCPQSATHLGDELDTAGVAWREYAEGMGAPCNLTGADGGDFAPSHVPFLYYDDVYTASGQCVEHVRDYGDFAADLAAGSYAFAMISPDTCHDMQTLCSANTVLQGDDWLSINVPPVLATAGFGSGGHDALFIVWEEAGTDLGTPPMPLIVVSPLARATTTAADYTHDSLLATIEDGLGVARLGNSAGAAPIADVWK
jgi:phosphatidylinositol-3-phosphatase